MHRAGDLPLVPLVELADVDEERRIVGGEELARASRVDLVDLGAQLGEQFAVRRHRSRHGTGAISGYARAVASGRVVGIVALCAVAAVVVIVGGTVLLSRHESTACSRAVAGHAGPAVELGVGATRRRSARRRRF